MDFVQTLSRISRIFFVLLLKFAMHILSAKAENFILKTSFSKRVFHRKVALLYLQAARLSVYPLLML